MWETIKILLITLERAFAAVIASKSALDKVTLRSIGYDLFVFYSHLNDIVIRGDQIVDALEAFVADDTVILALERFPNPHEACEALEQSETLRPQYPTSLTSWWGPKDAGISLANAITSQLDALKEVVRIFDRNRLEIGAIDADLSRSINGLLDRKNGRLRILRGLIDGHNLYSWLAPFPEGLSEFFVPRGESLWEPYRIAWTRVMQRRLRDYLAITKPREELDAIQLLSDNLRSAIEKNFTLPDLLCDIRRNKGRTT